MANDKTTSQSGAKAMRKTLQILVANDVMKDECCSILGVGYNDYKISDAAIFMLHAEIRKEACKPCRGL